MVGSILVKFSTSRLSCLLTENQPGPQNKNRSTTRGAPPERLEVICLVVTKILVNIYYYFQAKLAKLSEATFKNVLKGDQS